MQTAATFFYSCRIISSFGASIRVTNVTSRRIVDALVDSETTRRVLFLSLARFFHPFSSSLLTVIFFFSHLDSSLSIFTTVTLAINNERSE